MRVEWQNFHSQAYGKLVVDYSVQSTLTSFSIGRQCSNGQCLLSYAGAGGADQACETLIERQSNNQPTFVIPRNGIFTSADLRDLHHVLIPKRPGRTSESAVLLPRLGSLFCNDAACCIVTRVALQYCFFLAPLSLEEAGAPHKAHKLSGGEERGLEGLLLLPTALPLT